MFFAELGHTIAPSFICHSPKLHCLWELIETGCLNSKPLGQNLINLIYHKETKLKSFQTSFPKLLAINNSHVDDPLTIG